jgi:hypothetical protein
MTKKRPSLAGTRSFSLGGLSMRPGTGHGNRQPATTYGNENAPAFDGSNWLAAAGTKTVGSFVPLSVSE